MPHNSPLRLLPAAEPRTRSATLHTHLARGGRGRRVLTTPAALAEIGDGSAPMPTVTFHCFNPTPKVYDASASGSAVEAGTPYDFDVFADGDVRLWRNDRKVPPHHKAALRAAILAAYRAATVTPAEATA